MRNPSFVRLAVVLGLLLLVVNLVPMAQDPTPNPFMSMGDLERQLGLLEEEPLGDPETPWLQMYATEEMVDTSMYVTEGPWNICFSNASVGNNWRVSGFGVMNADVQALIDEGKVAEFIVTDAGENADKQISDIDDLLTRDCDIIIISPTSTEQLTPAVEKAAESGIPVIVFDRGVNTTAYTTFIHPIGGYAFGHVGATWLVDQIEGAGNVLALRILPGVDVLETRWLAAEQIFSANPDISVVGVEFNDNDPAKTKSIVTDYIQRVGQIDGVWMDAGETSVAVYEAFIDQGMPVPPITSEDVNGWLKVWSDEELNSIAVTYPSFQWRTAIAAAVMILEGQSVPKEWVLPQPFVTNETVVDYVQPELPDTYYVFSSGATIEGYLDSLMD